MKRSRPQALPSVTFERQTHCGKIYVTVTTDAAGLPFEVLVRFGKAGHCGAAVFDGLARILSYALRSGLEPGEAVRALAGIGCSKGKHTCMNAVSESLEEVAALPLAPAGARGSAFVAGPPPCTFSFKAPSRQAHGNR